MPESAEEGKVQRRSEDFDGKIEQLKKELPVLHWGRIRFIGSLRIVSLIPFVGASVIAILRLPQFSTVNAKRLLQDAATLYALMAFLISLYSAYIIYHIFCPPMIRKFESLAELYREQLAIKKAQKETYPSDDEKFIANLDHVTETYAYNLKNKPFARWSALFLFVFSLISLYLFLAKFRALLIDP